jgi:hypothetical protein
MNQYGLVEPLTNLTINSILKKEVNFIGCFSRENLPVINKLPISFIINTHESNQPGEHWLAFYIDINGAEFFDSYGNSPNYFGHDLVNYLNKYKNWIFNKTKIQGNSNNCGYYCILFIMYRSKNKLKEFFNEFRFNSVKNDFKLEKLIKKFSIN